MAAIILGCGINPELDDDFGAIESYQPDDHCHYTNSPTKRLIETILNIQDEETPITVQEFASLQLDDVNLGEISIECNSVFAGDND